MYSVYMCILKFSELVIHKIKKMRLSYDSLFFNLIQLRKFIKKRYRKA